MAGWAVIFAALAGFVPSPARAANARSSSDSQRARTHKAKPKKAAKKKATRRRPETRRSKHARWAATSGPPNAPAIRYMQLDTSACLAELERRAIRYRSEPDSRGVEIPVRLLGPVGGVLYRTDASDAVRAHSPWEIFDCRLVLALDDFGEILARYQVVEARIFSAWRPPPKRALNQPQRRHPAALAVDVRAFRTADSQEFVVLKHFEGHIGAPVCQPKHPTHTEEGRKLVDIVCSAADAHLFNAILTPNYDVRHRNHFHLELTPDVRWFLLR